MLSKHLLGKSILIGRGTRSYGIQYSTTMRATPFSHNGLTWSQLNFSLDSLEKIMPKYLLKYIAMISKNV